MKRIPIEQARLLQSIAEHRAEREHRKEFKRKNLLKNNSDEKKVKPPNDYNDWPELLLPEKFSLARNYDEVINAISQVRKAIIGRRLYINFDAIRQIDAAAVLMLAAELEVVKFYHKPSKMATDNSNWSPKVRALVNQMGFLELLAPESKISSHTESTKRKVFVKFKSGNKVIGETVMQIIKNLQGNITVGELSPDLLLHLYAGIVEATINTFHHAHNDDHKYLNDELNRWWISASIDKKTNKIEVVCYDRGATIPITIRNSDKKWKGVQFFWQGLFEQYSDGEIIHAAMELTRTSTNLEERGKGLPELLRLIDENNQGILRIYSGTGMAEFFPIQKKKKPKFSKLSQKMQGTLIEWSIILSNSTKETSQNGIPH